MKTDGTCEIKKQIRQMDQDKAICIRYLKSKKGKCRRKRGVRESGEEVKIWKTSEE